MNTEEYYIGNEEQPYEFIFVTGACRSGKTTISRILGSMQGFEWIEEPYELRLLLTFLQLCEDKKFWAIGGKLFTAICKELANGSILLRNGNFRPEDLSSIWKYKDATEIFQRLTNINTRADVRDYIQKNNNGFIVDIPEVLGSSEFIKKSYKDMRIIHVVRNPYDVADAVCQKHWNSDYSLQNVETTGVYRKFYYNKANTEYFIPWWVSGGNELDYICATEYERGILYWISMVEDKRKEDKNKAKEQSDYVIKYEDLVRHPVETLQNLFNLCGKEMKPTSRTFTLCGDLKNEYISGERKDIHLSQHFMDKFTVLKEIYGYE